MWKGTLTKGRPDPQPRSYGKPAADAPDSAPKPGRQEGVLSTLAVLVAAGTLGATALAALARHVWIADLLVHFRLQYAAAAFAAAVLLALRRRVVWAVAAVLACLVNVYAAAPVLGWAWPPEAAAVGSTRAEAAPATELRIVTLNVFYRSDSHARVADFIRTAHADAVVLTEVTPEWRRELQVLRTDFPFEFFSGDAHERGVLLLSRLPLAQAEVVPAFSDDEPPLLATLLAGERTLRVLGVHASWPMLPADAEQRNRQLRQLARLTREIREPLVVLGDLNISPFSPHFQALLADGGLRSAAENRGWQPTWPSFLPPLGIQIDHALVSPGVRVRDFQVGPSVGSDHRAVIVDLAL